MKGWNVRDRMMKMMQAMTKKEWKNPQIAFD